MHALCTHQNFVHTASDMCMLYYHSLTEEHPWANGTRSHRVTCNFIFTRKVHNALHEWLIGFLSLACFLGNRSYGHQIFSQQQAIIDLYLREISSPQNSCVCCKRPFSSLLQKSCGNIYFFFSFFSSSICIIFLYRVHIYIFTAKNKKRKKFRKDNNDQIVLKELWEFY